MIYFDEYYVCTDCIQNEDLAEVISEDSEAKPCSFCEQQAPTVEVADLCYVLERMRERIRDEYTAPESQLGWDSELGWIGEVLYGASELFEAIQFGVENEELQGLLEGEFNESYCTRDHYGPAEDEVFQHAWERFSETVKHRQRYTFWMNDESGPLNMPGADITVGELMDVIGKDVCSLVYVISLPEGFQMWRIRLFELGEASDEPGEHSSPPREKANQPNRMSPAGVPMFYGSEDFETAFVETVDSKGNANELKEKEASGMIFETNRPLKLLDLSSFPKSFGFFAAADYLMRQTATFLSSFERELTKNIDRDGRQYTEYVPSQVFTEYVRYILSKELGELHGMKYKSSKNKKDCYVLFAEQEACLGGATAMLKPVAGSRIVKKCKSK